MSDDAVAAPARRSAEHLPAIHTVELGKTYRKAVALAGLSMTVQRGEVFGFLGPNGAGKTTAVKLLLGLARPTSGEAFVLGAPVGDLQTRKRIGYLPELFRYQDWLTAREVLALHCSLAKLPRSRWPDEVAQALEVVGLKDRSDDRVGTYSKGMQQRLGLGVALLGKPDLVVLDEPTSALDPVGRHDVREIIRSLQHRGATVFLNSHLLTEVEQVCDRVAVVNRGHVIAVNYVHELTTDIHSVRIRCTGLESSALQSLSGFGEISHSDGWYTVHGIEAGTVPDLVEALVRLGGRVYAVAPGHQTLEQRFLELLKGSQHAGADDSTSHPI
jgi:ABC-2 type transport system ATP-binding protein